MLEGRIIYRLQLQDRTEFFALREDKQKLFGKFQKLTAKPTAGEETVGLGLSIVKKYVEAMNGKVWCESALGNGSTFIVELNAMD